MNRSSLLQHDLILTSPLGQIGVRVENQQVVDVTLLLSTDEIKMPPNHHWLQAWFNAYFDHASNWSPLQCAPTGTTFQRRVWHALQQLASGEVLTYGELAQSLDTSPRAIGQACRANPCPIIVPCHRVIAATGRGGFHGQRHGAWADIKTWLLQHEGVRL